ncbi:MAG: CusA/CzcA family heavy metal efflux RND transporter, partial [Thermodesulfobacteriota bacterium]
RQLAIEAYPDISDTQAQVITQYPGHAAEEMEQQITIPLERELRGIPGLHVMRSKSTFGLSLITMVFRDGVEDYWARQRIRERISKVDLPRGVEAVLDPLTSAVGEIYRYTLESKIRDQRSLRELQEWVVIPRLKQVFGIADVSNFGGETTQFQVFLNPANLVKYNLSLKQVTEAIQANNANAGGSIIVHGQQGLVVRGLGWVRSPEELGLIIVTQKGGTPILLRDLGQVQWGALERKGIFGKDDNDDSVSGIVLLLRGENPSRVLEGIYQKVDELNRKILPPDVKIVPYLDRATLVHTTLHTVSRTLLEGMGLVVLMLILFLENLRGALLVALTIPISLLFAFILMHLTHIPANLLSLGAIDFGIIVNGAVVIMEVIFRRREQDPGQALSQGDARSSVLEVAKPMFFATVIIMIAYLPLFAFERVEKKLFTPISFAVCYALSGGLLFALLAVPPLAYWAFRKPGRTFANPLLVWIGAKYSTFLRHMVLRPRRALLAGAAIASLAVVLALLVGREFLPYIDEGTIWLQAQMPPGISLAKATEMSRELRMAVREFPEVSYVVTQLGRTDDGMDPWTPSHIECCIGLKPYREWGGDKQALIRRMSARLTQLPSMAFGFSQPIIDMVNDKIAGAHSELVIKIFGDDLTEGRRIAQDIAAVLASVKGAVDVAIDQEPPLPQLQIKVNREAAARFGINVADIADLIETAVGGKAVSFVFIGERKYNINVRYIEAARNSPEAVGNLTLTSSTGARIPLSQVAEVKLGGGESTITREMNQRHMTVKVNMRDRDLASFLNEAQKVIGEKVKYDATLHRIEWGGQFENQRRAETQLALIIPGVLVLIFLLLYAEFGELRQAALILLTVPLALLGGLAALYFRGMTLNVSSAVGFIALFGVAVQNGVIMVANLNLCRRLGMDLKEAIICGAGQRLRPVLMTASVATLGLLPAALTRMIGSDVQRPLATVVVGGLISATVLTLIVLPAAYLVLERWFEKSPSGNFEEPTP